MRDYFRNKLSILCRAFIKNKLRLINISDEHAINCAKIAKINSDFKIERFGGQDDGFIIIDGKSGRGIRSLRIYFNGSNTKCLHNGFEVIEFCFPVYDYLRTIGYDVEPYKHLKQ